MRRRLSCVAALCLLLALPQFGYSAALVVEGNVNLNGNSVVIDSYDSGDPTKSTAGRYDFLKAGDHADVFACELPHTSLSVGNANIYGALHLGFSSPYGLGAGGLLAPLLPGMRLATRASSRVTFPRTIF